MGEKSKPLVIFIGGDSCRLGSNLDLDNNEVLFLDTDLRTESRVRKGRFFLVADEVVKGEGCGGNLNLARVCFKKEMERIGGFILGRSLLIIVCSMEGATSVAGAVEINSLMIRVGLPSLVLMIGSFGIRNPSERSLNLSNLLITGPLRPGVRLDLAPEEEDHDLIEGSIKVKKLQQILTDILKGVEGPTSVRIPPIAWNLLRENGGPFRVGSSTFDKGKGTKMFRMKDTSPTINVLEVGISTTTNEVRDFVSSYFGDAEGVHLGLIEEESLGDSWRLTSIYPSIEESSGMDEGKGPGRFRDMDEIMAQADLPDISPHRGL
jgi:hypothetical protein